MGEEKKKNTSVEQLESEKQELEGEIFRLKQQLAQAIVNDNFQKTKIQKMHECISHLLDEKMTLQVIVHLLEEKQKGR